MTVKHESKAGKSNADSLSGEGKNKNYVSRTVKESTGKDRITWKKSSGDLKRAPLSI